jgi:16S rRNA (guanine527-N7)-methyltransferase
LKQLAEALPSLDLDLEAFERFEEALYESNRVMNLTRVPREEAWLRHFLDSLLFQDLIPQGARVLDVGTGPGLPAWPLACARPDLQVTALDSNGKMLGFLKSQPLPNLEIVQARAEEWPRKEAYDVVTGRALAPLPVQLEVSSKPCKVGGAVIPMRTAADRASLAHLRLEGLGLQLDEVVERELPGAEVPRLFPIFRKVSRTDQQFPRRWAEIKAKPLTKG